MMTFLEFESKLLAAPAWIKTNAFVATCGICFLLGLVVGLIL